MILFGLFLFYLVGTLFVWRNTALRFIPKVPAIMIATYISMMASSYIGGAMGLPSGKRGFACAEPIGEGTLGYVLVKRIHDRG